jgi:multiple antibiotic resistance protein
MSARLLGLIEFAILATASIVAVMEPFSTIAVYVTLTKDMDYKRRHEIASKSMKISFIALSFFALAGHVIFSIFNITISAFEIAGGILLIVVAFGMLAPERGGASAQGVDISIVPLAFPLTAGPGSITTVMLLVSKVEGVIEVPLVFLGILLGVLISYVGMVYSSKMIKLLGEEGLRTITAFMAIIVLAIAVQFIVEGAAQAYVKYFPKQFIQVCESVL